MDELLQRHRFVIRHQRQQRVRAIQEAYRDIREPLKREVRHDNLHVDGDVIR